MITGVSPELPHTDDLPPIRQWSLRIIRRPVAWLIRLLWQVQVRGADLVPSRGPVILAANHIGILDGPLLVAVSRRLSFAMAKYELFRGFGGALFSHVGQIPVNRRAVDKRAIRRAVQVLRQGKVLAVFPEGVRGAGQLTYAQGGAVYLALVTGAPIVPVALLGTREAGQPTSALPQRGAPIHVVYGKPIRFPQTGWPRRKSTVAELTEQLRRQLADHVAAAEALTGLPLPGPPAPRPLHAARRQRHRGSPGRWRAARTQLALRRRVLRRSRAAVASTADAAGPTAAAAETATSQPQPS